LAPLDRPERRCATAAAGHGPKSPQRLAAAAAEHAR
jgi:hypothetical protein